MADEIALTMRADIKAEWLADLRSGEYEQATGVLKSGSGRMCCLGVLANILAKRGIGFWTDDDNRTFKMAQQKGIFNANNIESRTILPPAAQRWLGLSESFGGSGLLAGFLDDDGAIEELAGLNDSRFTFARIADIIDYAIDGVEVVAL